MYSIRVRPRCRLYGVFGDAQGGGRVRRTHGIVRRSSGALCRLFFLFFLGGPFLHFFPFVDLPPFFEDLPGFFLPFLGEGTSTGGAKCCVCLRTRPPSETAGNASFGSLYGTVMCPLCSPLLTLAQSICHEAHQCAPSSARRF